MSKGKYRVILAGATGWAGSALARAISQSSDIALVGAVSRNASGQDLRDVLSIQGDACPIFASAEDSLEIPSDVFFEYTTPSVAHKNVLSALARKVNVVIGTSGLQEHQFQEIDKQAKAASKGVLAVGNFALTVILLQKFAEIAARYIDHWEIIDYARDEKRDSPSGTARELAYRLSKIKVPMNSVPLNQIVGERESRGSTMSGTQVHSVRLPGHVIGAEIIFGMKDQKLSIRQDSGASAEPYNQGALLAIRKVGQLVGLHRGLDTVMDLEG